MLPKAVSESDRMGGADMGIERSGISEYLDQLEMIGGGHPDYRFGLERTDRTLSACLRYCAVAMF